MSKKYIEYEALVNDLSKNSICDKITYSDGRTITDIIAQQSVADVEEVVYCKDCKHLNCFSAVDREFYCRHIHGMKGCLNPIEENPFCCYGEKRSE